eukprot:6758378-Pyramimonas_sp.AAC.1
MPMVVAHVALHERRSLTAAAVSFKVSDERRTLLLDERALMAFSMQPTDLASDTDCDMMLSCIRTCGSTDCNSRIAFCMSSLNEAVANTSCLAVMSQTTFGSGKNSRKRASIGAMADPTSSSALPPRLRMISPSSAKTGDLLRTV